MKIPLAVVPLCLLACGTGGQNRNSLDATSENTTSEITESQIMETRWEMPCSIRSIEVLDDSTVFYAGSNGWMGLTRDAGNRWESFQWTAPDGSNPSFRATGFNGQQWFAASIESPGYIIRHSPSFGQIQVVHTDKRPEVFWDAMAWWNESEGLVFGDPVEGCMTLLTTRDSGVTWHQTPCDLLPTPMPGEAGFAASNGNIATSGDSTWVFTGGRSSRCWFSGDRGRSWSIQELPILQGGVMTGVFSAHFVNHLEGKAMGGNWELPEINEGNLIQTQDGGQHWTLLSEGSGPGYRSSLIHHPERPQELVSVGFLGMDVSRDGGETWFHASDSSHFVARFSPSGRTLWLAGNKHVARLPWP
ncbi:MAG: oxidoreductase [Bacteroidetes bacterium]|nr:oxidoreductase [Bacteroidota bacterium]MDA0903972.1 oxidoreductase [Bacteroidota bacterium]MDA1243152.1 oxidoreductase [Bacteroidota bacterium]